MLFPKYAICHVLNFARYLTPEEISMLDDNIKGFFQYLRQNFPYVTTSPKLYMMEDYIIPFIKRWGAGCGFFGELGGGNQFMQSSTI